MDDGRTEPFEPYQPETSYDWDYEEEPPKPGAPKILWGRLVAILVVIVLAFLLGRATAGSDGVSQERYDALQEQRDQIQDALDAALEQRAEQAEESPPPSEDSESPPPDNSDSEIYVVQEGDTLRGIAEKFYDDASLDDVIADANGIDDPTQISVGQELIIPPKPEE
jgi:hypothetical protein